MIMIQETMDFFTGTRKEAFSVLPKKDGAGTGGKASEAKPQTVKPAGNISVSAFCTRLASSGVIIGRNQMFKWLRANGYISKQKGIWNMPLQKHVSEGILAVKETFVLVADEQVPRYSPLITSKGRAYFTEKLMERNIEPKKKKTV